MQKTVQQPDTSDIPKFTANVRRHRLLIFSDKNVSATARCTFGKRGWGSYNYIYICATATFVSLIARLYLQCVSKNRTVTIRPNMT